MPSSSAGYNSGRIIVKYELINLHKYISQERFVRNGKRIN